MAEDVNLELREALRVVSALDARINVRNSRMFVLVVFDQSRDIVVDFSALDATVNESTENCRSSVKLTYQNERCSWWHLVT